MTYQQPSRQSVALNRVLSADPSQIYGHLNANGSVILINPNGVVFGPGANINVGAMILSTMDLSDSDFLSNNYHFTTPSADSLSVLTPQILSQGSVNATAGGSVYLIHGASDVLSCQHVRYHAMSAVEKTRLSDRLAFAKQGCRQANSSSCGGI